MKKLNEQDKNCQLDEFKIIKDLGSGYHSEVKLGKDHKGQLFAIKIYNKKTTNLSTLQNEVQMMRRLKHDNIVKLICSRQNASYKTSDNKQQKCYAIILEYLEGGQLIDLINQIGHFSERVTRSFFNQIMNGLHFIHQSGIVHRDMKLQNLILAKELSQIKIVDLGFSCLRGGKDGSGILHTFLGTQNYMAPQIQTKSYDGTKVDIFSVGIILFSMRLGIAPFLHIKDPLYKLIIEKKFNQFWQTVLKKRNHINVSQDFKDLFVRMVAFDPKQRPTIMQISVHPWVKGDICSKKELAAEISKIKSRLNPPQSINMK